MTKRTNAELLLSYAAKSARLRRIEASKGDDRIRQANKLALALSIFAGENLDIDDENNCLRSAIEVLDRVAAQWVDEFFDPKE